MIDKQIIIDDYFRKIVDINGKIVDYEIKNSEVLKLVQKLKKYNSYIKRKEQECEELKEKYKWYDHYKEQALYNKNLCNEKSDKIDQLKADREEALKQLEFVRTLNTVREAEIRKLFKTLAEIEKYLDAQQKYFDGEDYHNLLDIINKAKVENNNV